MKNTRGEIIRLLKSGYAAPKIAALAAKLKIPGATIHYNVKRLEKENAIIGYKAVFNHKRIGEGFCTFMFLNLSKSEYKHPERIARILAKYHQVESVDIVTGQWDIILKIRTKDMDEYYQFVKDAISIDGIEKEIGASSMDQIKSEFIEI